MPVATRLDERLERLGDEGEVAQPACKVVLVRDGVEEEIRYCFVQKTFTDFQALNWGPNIDPLNHDKGTK